MGEKTTISVLEGNNFVVSDLRGDIDASPSEPLGLFAWDTRFLSRWLLTVDGLRPNALSTVDLKMRLEAAADFADLFEVKDALKKKGEFYQRIESDRLVLGYRREQFVRETLITASAK